MNESLLIWYHSVYKKCHYLNWVLFQLPYRIRHRNFNATTKHSSACNLSLTERQTPLSDHFNLPLTLTTDKYSIYLSNNKMASRLITQRITRPLRLSANLSRNMSTSSARKHEFLCIIPDKAGAREKRLEVRPYVDISILTALQMTNCNRASIIGSTLRVPSRETNLGTGRWLVWTCYCSCHSTIIINKLLRRDSELYTTEQWSIQVWFRWKRCYCRGRIKGASHCPTKGRYLL